MDKKIKYISFFCAISSFFIYIFLNYDIKIAQLCQHDARPVIYGEDLCNEIYHNKIILSGDLFEKFIYLFSSKSVLHAKFGDSNVILKTLVPKKFFGDVEELFDKKFSNKALHSPNNVEIAKLHIHSSMRISAGSILRPKLRLCPDSGNIENLYHKINSSNFKIQDYLHLWTIVHSNPEPLILKMLKPPEWPVPQYYGSCGRLIIVEDCGLMLSQFYGAVWQIRASLSYQLIESAFKFTFGDPDFAYYLTDMSPDNIAVTNDGQTRFIDLENVILVDKNPLMNDELMKSWDYNHTSKHFDCNDCFIFESDEICLHRFSDHNIYALCKEIFADSSLFPGGFLHSPPSGLSELNKLTKDCVEALYNSRFDTANKLLSLLKPYLDSRGKRNYYKMVANFKVFKKVSPNGKVTVYLGKRDFVDHVTAIEPIDGVVLIDESYLGDRKVFGQVVCSFRYGREEDEVMGLNFQKDLYLCSAQLYPPPEKKELNLTKLQDRLLKKLGPNAFPFTFQMPQSAPASITIQPGPEDHGEPCGVQYFLKVFVGEHETDRLHRRSTVSLGIRKIQYAPTKVGRQPCTIVRKDFMLSPGELELEVVLDKQVYHHGERIATNICIRNNSNKVVKKIKAMVQQGVDVMLFQNGQYRTTIAAMETDEGCPIQPGSSMQKVIYLVPEFSSNKDRRGIALDGQLKSTESNLASSTLFACPDQKDIFGIVVSYAVKVKLYLGALSGELTAELPVIIMHPKPSKPKFIQTDSQAEVESFRQDTLDIDAM